MAVPDGFERARTQGVCLEGCWGRPSVPGEQAVLSRPAPRFITDGARPSVRGKLRDS